MKLASQNHKHPHYSVMHFDILNGLVVDRDCNGQTDEQTDRTAASNSTV